MQRGEVSTREIVAQAVTPSCARATPAQANASAEIAMNDETRERDRARMTPFRGMSQSRIVRLFIVDVTSIVQ
jgi:hypothetical protein